MTFTRDQFERTNGDRVNVGLTSDLWYEPSIGSYFTIDSGKASVIGSGAFGLMENELPAGTQDLYFVVEQTANQYWFVDMLCPKDNEASFNTFRLQHSNAGTIQICAEIHGVETVLANLGAGPGPDYYHLTAVPGVSSSSITVERNGLVLGTWSTAHDMTGNTWFYVMGFEGTKFYDISTTPLFVDPRTAIGSLIGWGIPLNTTSPIVEVLLYGDSFRYTQSPVGAWTTVGYDDSAWSVGPQPFVFTDVALGTPNYYYPSPWDKYGLDLISGEANTASTQYVTPSTIYARRTFTVPTSDLYKVAGACDNNLDVYIDGMLWNSFAYGGYAGPLYQSLIYLTAGTHLVAYHGTGDSFYDGHGVAIWR